MPPVTLAKIIERVDVELGHETAGEERAALELIVRATVHAMGMHFADNGEVCDPRPTPRDQVITFPYDPHRSSRIGTGGSRRRR